MYQRTYAKIDLDALEHNIQQIINKIGSEDKLLCVVKADAYGHGSTEIARFLDEKCAFFGVACVEEALELTDAGINTPILILGYVSPKVYEIVVRNDFRIPVFSYDMAKSLSDEAVRQNKTARFHFCVDTGMSRIGFQVTEEDADICKDICALPNIYAEGLFSHFATADEKNLYKTLEQKNKFDIFVDYLVKRKIDVEILHLNNSAGIINFGGAYNMVRAGIIIYGLYPSEEIDKELIDLKPVMSWHTHVSHIKTLPAGREISYGGTYKLNEEKKVATVPVGYADGYPRCLSSVGRVLINGQYAPILGRVCMDQFMVDVTHIDDVRVETPVTLIGEDNGAVLTMEEVSDLAHSFNYELPCRLAGRVPRIYYKNSKQIKTINKLVD